MPHVAIADTGSAAASLLNGLNAAANQQAALQQRQQAAQVAQDHQDQQDQFRAIQDGWIPANAETRLPGGLIDRTKPSTPNQDPNRVATIGHKQFYKQTDLETGKAFIPTGPLADALESAGWKRGTPISSEHSHGIMQSLNEAQPKDEGWDIDASGKFLGADGKPTPVMIGKKTGTVRMLGMGGGAQPAQPGAAQPSAPGAAPGGAFAFALPEKADKPDIQQMIPGQQGPNGGMLVFNKNTQSIDEVPYPKGSKPVMTAAQTEADKDRHEREADRRDAREARTKMMPATARLIVKSKADGIAKANSEYEKALGTAITPEEKAAAGAARKTALQQAQNEYEESLSAATGQDVPHNDWADKYGGSAPSATAKSAPVAPAKVARAPAGAPKKKYTAAEITEWAKTNQKDPADALARAKKAGLL